MMTDPCSKNQRPQTIWRRKIVPFLTKHQNHLEHTILKLMRKFVSVTQIQYGPTYKNIATASSNFRKAIAYVKKAPLVRRTVEFYSKKLKEMEALWADIDRKENSIQGPSSRATYPSNRYQVIG